MRLPQKLAALNNDDLLSWFLWLMNLKVNELEIFHEVVFTRVCAGLP